MKPPRPQSLAEKEAEARKNSVLLKYAYHTTPTKGMMRPEDCRKVRPELLEMFEEMVAAAAKYRNLTGYHVHFLGELGEMFAEIMFGIKRHAPMTQGSDGKLGNNLVEIKTITRNKKSNLVQVKRAGHFSKLVVVKISDDFQFGARMVDRRILKPGDREFDTLTWDAMVAGEPDQEMHRNFPIRRVAPRATISA